MRWGFIPSWAEGKPSAATRACAEFDRIERSKTYRMPWLSGQRCILPMSGFYLWQLTAENYRQPYFVNLTDRSVFGVAAIWDRSVAEDDDVIESCSIIRVAANDLLTGIAPVPAACRRFSGGATIRLGCAAPCRSESCIAAVQGGVDAGVCGQSAHQFHPARRCGSHPSDSAAER